MPKDKTGKQRGGRGGVRGGVAGALGGRSGRKAPPVDSKVGGRSSGGLPEEDALSKHGRPGPAAPPAMPSPAQKRTRD